MDRFTVVSFWWALRALWHAGYPYTPRSRWQHPFCCNGNLGGWRTRLCDWLENKARDAENREMTV